VEQKPADELNGVKTHGTLHVLVGVVFPVKLYFAIVKVNETLVGDSDSVSVSCEVFKDSVSTAKRGFCVNNPFALLELSDELFPVKCIRKMLHTATEGELSFAEGLCEIIQELLLEEGTEHPHRKEEVLAAGDPLFAIRGDASTRHHAVNMRVKLKTLTPRMQDGEKTDLSAEVFWIMRNREKSFRGSAEKDRVDQTFVLNRHHIESVRNSEDNMEVFDTGQEILSPCLKPLGPCCGLALWTMTVTTGIEINLFVSAFVAFLHMTTQGGRSATDNVSQYLSLLVGRPMAIGVEIHCSMESEDIGHLKLGATHDCTLAAAARRS
jgi:hypothetical protein